MLTGVPRRMANGQWAVKLDEKFDGPLWKMRLHYVGQEVLVRARSGREWTITAESVPEHTFGHAVVSKQTDFAALRVAEQLRAEHEAAPEPAPAPKPKPRTMSYEDAAQPAAAPKDEGWFGVVKPEPGTVSEHAGVVDMTAPRYAAARERREAERKAVEARDSRQLGRIAKFRVPHPRVSLRPSTYTPDGVDEMVAGSVAAALAAMGIGMPDTKTADDRMDALNRADDLLRQAYEAVAWAGMPDGEEKHGSYPQAVMGHVAKARRRLDVLRGVA